MGDFRLVMAREHIPTGPSVFLAGPTSHSSAIPSWRPAAIAALADQWTGAEPLTVLSPESRHGVRAEVYGQQVHWELKARAAAGVIMFWIPRDVKHLPGMTTNVEYGYDLAKGRRVVLGAPADCPSPECNRYLIYLAEVHAIPVCRTLADTAAETNRLITTTE